MKLTRRLGAAAIALAVGTGLVLAMGPADAAPKPAVATATALTVDTQYTGFPKHYGDSIFLNVTVTGADGTSPYQGTITIFERPVGSSTWTPMTSQDGFAYLDTTLKSPVEFYASYAGHPASDSYDTPYGASQSTVLTFGKVGRGELLVKDTKKKVCYRVGPKAYKNKPVTHYYRIGKKKKWHFAYSERTNKKSQICWKPVKLKKAKHVKKTKGPKITAEKTVYVKTGGMKKTTVIDKF